MPPTWDYARALAELWNRSSYERGLISDPFGDPDRAERGLARMRALLLELGNPHLRLPTAHVAGSKGKGSTSALIAAAAAAAGHRVGLYSSPHLHRFPERIAINGNPVDDAAFAAQAEHIAAAARRLEQREPGHGMVTTFEFVTAMAFSTFAAAECDLAVIEVGLGGRYDATNLLSPLVTVITRIDLEHTAVLGPTYADIAAQKAGILRPGVTCVASPQAPQAASVIASHASDVGCPLLLGGRDWTWAGTSRAFAARGPWGDWPGLAVALPGPHQVENACTALAALHVIDRAGVPVPEAAVRAGFASVRWPGRFERVSINERDFVLDGAHTPASARALLSTWRDELPGHLPTIVLGMGSDKDAASVLEALRPIVGRLIVTRADSPRAADPLTLARAAGQIGLLAEVQPSVAAAVAAAIDGRPGPVLVTGSLFVAGEAREALGLASPDLVWRAISHAQATPGTTENLPSFSRDGAGIQ
jgi:dihydrofolate synthase/folylpolyglutamate synthase